MKYNVLTFHKEILKMHKAFSRSGAQFSGETTNRGLDVRNVYTHNMLCAFRVEMVVPSCNSKCGHIDLQSFCALISWDSTLTTIFLFLIFPIYNFSLCMCVCMCCLQCLFSIFQLTWIIIRHSICLSIWKRVCVFVLALWWSRNGDYILWKDRVPSIHSSCRWFFFQTLL